MGFGGFSGFNIGSFEEGRQLAGQNAIGTFVRGLLERVNAMQNARMQSQAQIGTAVAQQKALMPGELAQHQAEVNMDPAKQFLGSLLGSGTIPGGGVSLQDRLAGIQGQLGPGQEISAGPLKISSNQLTPSEQSRLDLQTQQTRKAKQDIERSAHPIRSLFFGTNVPGEGEMQKVHAIRPDGRHVLIDQDKSDRARQLGYTVLGE